MNISNKRLDTLVLTALGLVGFLIAMHIERDQILQSIFVLIGLTFIFVAVLNVFREVPEHYMNVEKSK